MTQMRAFWSQVVRIGAAILEVIRLSILRKTISLNSNTSSVLLKVQMFQYQVKHPHALWVQTMRQNHLILSSRVGMMSWVVESVMTIATG
jgi:hypothetical protein